VCWTRPTGCETSLKYEGYLEIDERLLEDLLAAAAILREGVSNLGPVSASEA
jgi:hypothetical protein